MPLRKTSSWSSKSSETAGAVCDKADPATCALVLSDNPQAVEVLRLSKPDRVFLAYEGRRSLETLKGST